MVIKYQASLAQVTPVTILEIDLENRVNYTGDVSDVSKFATDPNVTTWTRPRNFGTIVNIGDIVAVNGRAARGTNVASFRVINARTAPDPRF